MRAALRATGYRAFAQQLRRIGVDSLPITLFIAAFTGIVLALLASYTFTGAVPAYLVGTMVHSESLQGLTHATGINLAANERWTLGANADVGTLTDAQTGAETDRKAGGVRVGYGRDSIQLASAIEYRLDETQQPDLAVAERTTWLFRNNVRYQLTRDWRIVGKLNHSVSDSSLGAFFDGGYTEAVLGYAYRPVDKDRLNALAKYTYFFNVFPTTDQVSTQGVPSEFIQKSHVAALG